MRFLKTVAKKTTKGFTLLEVIIAMAIVGLVMGSAFGLLAGSKRLAFRAADDIGRTVFLRAAINIAQVMEEPDYPELPEQYKKRLTLQVGEPLEKPERQTQPTMLALEPYTFTDEEKSLQLESVRWKILDTAQ